VHGHVARTPLSALIVRTKVSGLSRKSIAIGGFESKPGCSLSDPQASVQPTDHPDWHAPP